MIVVTPYQELESLRSKEADMAEEIQSLKETKGHLDEELNRVIGRLNSLVSQRSECLKAIGQLTMSKMQTV